MRDLAEDDVTHAERGALAGRALAAFFPTSGTLTLLLTLMRLLLLRVGGRVGSGLAAFRTGSALLAPATPALLLLPALCAARFGRGFGRFGRLVRFCRRLRRRFLRWLARSLGWLGFGSRAHLGRREGLAVLGFGVRGGAVLGLGGGHRDKAG